MAYLVASIFTTALPRVVGTITASSTPLNLSEVATVIERISVEVDAAAAGGGYDVPVSSTATSAYAVMQNIVEEGAAWKVLRTYFPDQGGPRDQASLAAEYRDSYLDHLKLLREGELVLIGAGQSSTQGPVLPRSFSTTSNATGLETGASVYVPRTWGP